MSTQSKSFSMIDLKTYIKVVAAVFSISAATAFALVLLRLIKPALFYKETPVGGDLGLHYVISGLMVLSSVIGFMNSCVVMHRSAARNTGRNITTWLLLDSIFETTRVVYIFMSEIVLKGKGPVHTYELVISAAQYLLDSFLYCQMILRH